MEENEKHTEIKIGWIEQSTLILKMMLDSEDCFEGFSKFYNKEINDNTSPNNNPGKILYRGVLKHTIMSLNELKDRILKDADIVDCNAEDLP